MKQQIIINTSPLEVRVALIEGRSLSQFFLEHRHHQVLAGNICKGRVTRVLPGMQAAFVEIGLEKAGFLHVSDFQDSAEAFGSLAEVVGEEDLEVEPEPNGPDNKAPGKAPAVSPGEAAPGGEGNEKRRRGSRRRSRQPIEHQLHRGQDIMVQIAKEPMGTKGARLTSAISLPGRYLVFTPNSNRLGVSRQIQSSAERARLREAVNALRPAQGGFIVRTACEGVTRRDIQRDISFLTRLWDSILKKNKTAPPKSTLYSDLDVALRTVRDLFSSDVEKLWCDDRPTYDRIVGFVRSYMPRLRSRVQFYGEAQPIFEHFDVEAQIDSALERKVWLKSGGYLVFDKTEALTAIDVNTGRFVGKRSQDETILKTNLEAVDEIVKQLRLRNIGGIIVLDFIDMTRQADRRRVSEALAKALKRDRARSNALPISELGLVQMTRKRTRESLEELLTERCPQCDGRGTVKSLATVAAKVLRGIHDRARSRVKGDMVVVKLNPEVAHYLYDSGREALEAVENQIAVKIVLRSQPGIAREGFELDRPSAAA